MRKGKIRLVTLLIKLLTTFIKTFSIWGLDRGDDKVLHRNIRQYL